MIQGYVICEGFPNRGLSDPGNQGRNLGGVRAGLSLEGEIMLFQNREVEKWCNYRDEAHELNLETRVKVMRHK